MFFKSIQEIHVKFVFILSPDQLTKNQDNDRIDAHIKKTKSYLGISNYKVALLCIPYARPALFHYPIFSSTTNIVLNLHNIKVFVI